MTAPRPATAGEQAPEQISAATGRLRPYLGSLALALLAALAALCALRLCLSAPEKTPVLLSASGEPEETTAAFLDLLCAGEYEQAAGYCEGGLPGEEPPRDQDAARLWEALKASWAWEPVGDAAIVGACARQTVRFFYLDTAALTAGLNAVVNAVLEEYVESAELTADVYNEDGSFREELVLRAWDEALDRALAEAPRYRCSTEIELELDYTDDGWRVLGSDALLRAMAGGA